MVVYMGCARVLQGKGERESHALETGRPRLGLWKDLGGSLKPWEMVGRACIHVRGWTVTACRLI